MARVQLARDGEAEDARADDRDVALTRWIDVTVHAAAEHKDVSRSPSGGT
jgi:hypothetical protein